MTDMPAKVSAKGARLKYLFAQTPYSLGEEIAHSATHGLGALLALGGLIALLVSATESGATLEIAAIAIYGASLFLCFLSSALYHGLPDGRAKTLFLLLDHCAIYLLIAGTVTPFALLVMAPSQGLPLAAIVWSLALLGILMKLAATLWPRFKAEAWIALPLYLAMGWLGVFWGEGLVDSLSEEGLLWLVTGGLLYSGGVVFYLLRALPLNHTLWHLCVLAAAGAHFHVIYSYVLAAT